MNSKVSEILTVLDSVCSLASSCLANRSAISAKPECQLTENDAVSAGPGNRACVI